MAMRQPGPGLLLALGRLWDVAVPSEFVTPPLPALLPGRMG